MPHIAGIGAITGIVTEDGMPAKKRVVLVDRSDLTIISKTQSNEDGKYVFNGLNPDTNDYLVFAVDDDGADRKNAIIHDYVQPIDAHMGGDYINNWLYLALHKHPIFINTNQTFNNQIYALTAVGCGDEQGTIHKNLPSQTPQAPHFPCTQLTNGTPIFYVEKIDNTNIATDKYTLEWIVDTSSAQISLFYTTSCNTTYYNRSAINTTINNKNLTLSIAGENILSHTITETGVIHLVIAIDFGVSATIYINGERVAEAPVNKTQLDYSTNYDSRVAYTSNPNLQNSNGITGLTAIYYQILTADEILEHYQALQEPREPLLTGYIKEIFIDTPCLIYRMNDIDIQRQGISEYFRPYQKLLPTNGNNLLPHQPSIIAGGNTVLFAGGYLRSNNDITLPNISHNGFTFEAIIKTNTSNPANQEILYRQEFTSTIYLQIERKKTSGAISVIYQLQNNNEEIIFNISHIPDTSHFAITIDKQTAQAKLYINGELTDTKSISRAPIKNYYSKEKNTSRTITIGQNFNGLLGDIAIYPLPLTENRIKSHYQSCDII